MTGKPANNDSGSQVYQAIKEQVFEPCQGQCIHLEPIAKRMGVSITPVREALNQLVTEGLVVRTARRGFIAMTLSEIDILGLYAHIRTSLTNGLGTLKPPVQQTMSTYAPIAAVLDRLRRTEVVDYTSIVTCTGEILAAIATLIGSRKVIRSVNIANDRLIFARTVECQHLTDVHSELVRFCELLLAGQCETLISAINTYHDRRLALLSALMESSPQ